MMIPSICRSTSLLLLLILSTSTNNVVHGADEDRFNYGPTTMRGTGGRDYGPPEWGKLDCTGAGDNLENCLGYPDKWQIGRGWEVKENSCKWCPDDQEDQTFECRRHHQSPINLERNRGIINHTMENECIDLHWMKYEDSTCTWDHLVENDAFTVERHALRISQPLNEDAADDSFLYQTLGCNKAGVGKRWGRIDFSKGFSEWWFLSHIDFHVPSEHTQEGKRYSAEAQMYHYYSVAGQDSGTDNELASVTVFMEAYEDAPHYEELDKVICQWRYWEGRQREECGLPQIDYEYPGCFPNYPNSDVTNLRRRRTASTTNNNKKETNNNDNNNQKTDDKDDSSSRTTTTFSTSSDDDDDDDENVASLTKQQFKTAHDVIFHNAKLQNQGIDLWTTKHPIIEMDKDNFRPADEKDWDAFIQQESKKHQQRDELFIKKMNENNNNKNYNNQIQNNEQEQQQQKKEDDDKMNTIIDSKQNDDIDNQQQQQQEEGHRKLINYDHLDWNNYFLMLGVRTEYYFRYEGTQTIPPCYGPYTGNTRANTTHWRVMKDPIRVHPRQIKEMERLLRDRIGPKETSSKEFQCQSDTAALIDPNTKEVSVARPLQKYHKRHVKTFCECKDWPSKWPEDRKWCEIDDVYDRFYVRPYNYHINTFDDDTTNTFQYGK